MSNVHRDPTAQGILAAAIEVHRSLGPGLMEGVYQACLWHELLERGIRTQREVAVPVMFKGIRLDCGFRLDFLVEGQIIVEVKSVERLAPIHTAQVLTYLRLSGASQVFLFNFNAVTLMQGTKSFLGGGHNRSQSTENRDYLYPSGHSRQEDQKDL